MISLSPLGKLKLGVGQDGTEDDPSEATLETLDARMGGMDARMGGMEQRLENLEKILQALASKLGAEISH